MRYLWYTQNEVSVVDRIGYQQYTELGINSKQNEVLIVYSMRY